MSRFSARQDDLFAAKTVRVVEATEEPVAALVAMLAMLCRADGLPWPDAAGAMAAEQRALGLAARAGEEGQALARAILEQTERLLALADEVATAR